MVGAVDSTVVVAGASFFSSSMAISLSFVVVVPPSVGFVSSGAAASPAGFSSVTINVETFSKMEDIGPETKAGPHLDDASLITFAPGKSIDNKKIRKKLITIRL